MEYVFLKSKVKSLFSDLKEKLPDMIIPAQDPD